jgi:hypothetical protein
MKLNDSTYPKLDTLREIASRNVIAQNVTSLDAEQPPR